MFRVCTVVICIFSVVFARFFEVGMVIFFIEEESEVGGVENLFLVFRVDVEI